VRDARYRVEIAILEHLRESHAAVRACVRVTSRCSSPQPNKMPQPKLKYSDYKPVSLYYESLDDERPKECTERQRRFLEKAKQQANKSSMGHRHGCVVVLDDTIIASGYNHFFMQNCHHYSMHSEVDAIMKVKKRMRPMLSQCELYVVRIAPNSMDKCLKYSKPCDDCTAYIRKVGIKKVYYSTNYEFEAMLQ